MYFSKKSVGYEEVFMSVSVLVNQNCDSLSQFCRGDIH